MDVTTSIAGGMVLDTKPARQPQNTRRYTLNGVFETRGTISCEAGNTSCFNNFSTGLIPTGYISITNNDTVVFLAGGTQSVIGIINQAGAFTQLVSTTTSDPTDLAFPITSQITGEYREIGCYRYIYWTDNFNEMRTLNIDQLSFYKDANGAWDTSTMALIRDFLVPTLTYSKTLDYGGNTQVGTYQFSILLTDADLNPTNWIYTTPAIPIVSGSLIGPYVDIQGGSINLTSTPFNNGNTSYLETNKSIQLSLSNLDTRFSFYQIACIATIGGVTSGYLIDTIPITQSTDTYVFTGLNPDTDTTIPNLANFAQPKIPYKTCAAMAQLDSRLLLGNISEPNIDYAAFQRAANLMQPTYFTRMFQYNSTAPNGTPAGAKGGGYYALTKSEMRDEIYSTGIVWVLTDGTETPVFHIPGRKLNTRANGQPINSGITGADEFAPVSSAFGFNVVANIHNRAQASDGVSNQGWDSADYNASDINSPYFADIQPFGTAVVPRWQAYNTAIRTVINSPEDVSNGLPFTQGELGYYQSTRQYPGVVDCNNIPIYPYTLTNAPGITFPAAGSYTMDFVRHLKMPDTTLEPNFFTEEGTTNGALNSIYNNNTDAIIPLGIQFDNVVPPAGWENKVQGYYIVRAERDAINSTVIDKGIMMNNLFVANNTDDTPNIPHGLTPLFYRQCAPYNKDRCLFFTPQDVPTQGLYNICNLPETDVPNFAGSDLQSDSQQIVPYAEYNCVSTSLHLPRNEFGIGLQLGDYYKVEMEVQGPTNAYVNQGSAGQGEFASTCEFINLQRPRNGRTDNLTSPIQYNCTSTPYVPILGTSCVTNRKILAQAPLSAKEYIAPGVFSIQFLNNNSLDAFAVETAQGIQPPTIPDNSLCFQDFSSTTQLAHAYYVSLKRVNNDMYGDITAINYILCSNEMIPYPSTQCNIFGGDCFISLMAVRKVLETADCGSPGAQHNHERSLFSWFGESIVNTELRNEGDLSITSITPSVTNVEVNGYFPKTFNTAVLLEGYLNLLSIDANTYYYNNDYSLENTIKYYLPLPIAFQYCNVCQNLYPRRVAASNKALQEDKQDLYRIFDPTFYIDLQGNTGEVTSFIVNKDQFYINTTQSMWFQSSKPQRIYTATGQVFFDADTLFSMPPQQLQTVKTGYSGCQSRISTITTEHGTLVIDQRLGKVFLLSSQGLDELTSVQFGMRNWFEKHLPSEMQEQYYNKFSVPFPLADNPSNPIGIGMQTILDRTNTRFIIFKKDYEIIDPSTLGSTLVFTNNQWYLEGVSINPYTRPDIFQNKSWTISFSLNEKSWTSYHSYIPDFAFYNANTFFTSTVGSNTFWEHNVGPYQTFYGTKQDFISELVINNSPNLSKLYNNITYTSDVNTYDTVNDGWIPVPDSTFDRLIAYNSSQSTGLATVTDITNTPYGVPYAANQVSVKHRENVWRINQLRDLYADKSISPFTSSWSENSYRLAYPIDKVPNSAAMDYNMDQYQQARLRDTHLIVRLFYKPVENYKIDLLYEVTDESHTLIKNV